MKWTPSHVCIICTLWTAVKRNAAQHSTEQFNIARYMENSDIVFTYVQIVYIIGHKSIT